MPFRARNIGADTSGVAAILRRVVGLGIYSSHSLSSFPSVKEQSISVFLRVSVVRCSSTAALDSRPTVCHNIIVTL